MRRTLPRGSNGKRSSGYVLLEVIAALAVIGVAGVALLLAASSCIRSVYRQGRETVRLVKDRNVRAKENMEDLPPQ